MGTEMQYFMIGCLFGCGLGTGAFSLAMWYFLFLAGKLK